MDKLDKLSCKLIAEELAQEIQNREKDNLKATVLSGSIVKNTFISGWSDIDLLTIHNRLDIKSYTNINTALGNVMKKHGIHIGLSFCTTKEFASAKLMSTNLKMLLTKHHALLGLTSTLNGDISEILEKTSKETVEKKLNELSSAYWGNFLIDFRRSALAQRTKQPELLTLCIKKLYMFLRFALYKQWIFCETYEKTEAASIEKLSFSNEQQNLIKDSNALRYSIKNVPNVNADDLSCKIIDFIEYFSERNVR